MAKEKPHKKTGGVRKIWRHLFPERAQAEEEEQNQRRELEALEGAAAVPLTHSIGERYKDYPLARSMLEGESTRNQILVRDGRKQDYTKSNDGWIKTLFVVEGRALDNIALAWTLCTLNAVFWTLMNQYALTLSYSERFNEESWEIFIALVVNTSLSFLLVFRLNRAAERFWLARQCWGTIVGDVRHLVSGIEAHGGHDPVKRDDAIRWAAAFPIAVMQYIRGISDVPPGMLAGILSPEDVKLLESSPHKPLYAADRVRAALTDLFCVTAETPPGLAHAWAQQMDTLEQTLNNMMDQEGAMERIRSTPLPLVYVAHLRIFLLFFLLTLPYIWYPSWQWFTIPIVFITSFALLGLEGTAMEVECPFQRDRANHLDMDNFCILALSTIQQTVCEAANRDIQRQSTRTIRDDVRESPDEGDKRRDKAAAAENNVEMHL